jgi:hypothetical protein
MTAGLVSWASLGASTRHAVHKSTTYYNKNLNVPNIQSRPQTFRSRKNADSGDEIA